MPPKRKALGTGDANAKPARKTNKKAKASPVELPEDFEAQVRERLLKGAIEARQERWSKVSGSKNWDADYLHNTIKPEPSRVYEQMCVCNPLKSHNEDDECGDEDDEDGAEERTAGEEQSSKCDQGDSCPCGKPASSLPSHPYTITRAGLARNTLARGMLNLRNPDAFGMYTYNDHMAYGAIEVVENMLIDFDDAFKQNYWREAWAIAEGMALFMLVSGGDTMYMADDSERVDKTGTQVVRMFLATLALLKHNDKMKPDSEVKNVGWVMSMYHTMVKEMQDVNLLEDRAPTNKQKRFRLYAGGLDFYLRSYAAQQGITVPGLGESSEEDDKLFMPDLEKKDPWSWATSFNDFKRESLGGDHLDITTFTPAQRKKAAYDGKDPFPKDAIKNLKEGFVLDLA